MNVRILVLKTNKLAAFLRPGNNLFRSTIVDGKNEILKTVVVCVKKGNV